jgi:hypothetical protein
MLRQRQAIQYFDYKLKSQLSIPDNSRKFLICLIGGGCKISNLSYRWGLCCGYFLVKRRLGVFSSAYKTKRSRGIVLIASNVQVKKKESHPNAPLQSITGLVYNTQRVIRVLLSALAIR